MNDLDIKGLEYVFTSERARSAYIAIYENVVKEHRTRFHSTALIELIKQRLGIISNTVAAEYLKLLDSQGAFWHPDSQRPNLFVVKPPHEIIKKDGGEDE